MKKLKKTLLIIGIALLIATPASAKSDSSAQGTSSQQYKITVSPSPLGDEVKNQNEVQTKNQGEEQQIHVENQEEEGLDGGTTSASSRSQAAYEHMSAVALKVQELLQLKTVGGLGEQIREVARLQSQSQDRIQEELGKLTSKNSALKLFTGPDYQSLKNLKQQIEQNRLRIRELEQLSTELTNKGELTTIQEAIQTLTKQNTALEEMVAVEEQTKSLLGWLFKLFVK